MIYDQLNEYLEQYLNSSLCGFRKSYSTQHANKLDKSSFLRTNLMDLSKADDCLPHATLQNLKLMASENLD